MAQRAADPRLLVGLLVAASLVRGFPAGEEVLAAPLSMSHQADPLPPCALPYTTTELEFVVLDSTGAIVLQTRFPGVYHFVPE